MNQSVYIQYNCKFIHKIENLIENFQPKNSERKLNPHKMSVSQMKKYHANF